MQEHMTKIQQELRQLSLQQVFPVVLPILLILAVIVGALLLKSQAAPPQYDFLYADQGDTGSYYRVESGQVVHQNLVQSYSSPSPSTAPSIAPAPSGTPSSSSAAVDERRSVSDVVGTLFYYDISEDTTREMTLDEANRYRLSDDTAAPDGYRFVHTRSGSFLNILDFGTDARRSPQLVGEKVAYDLHINPPSQPYRMQFVGWVIGGGPDDD